MLRIAVIQFRPRKGAIAENLARLGRIFETLAGDDLPPPDLVVLPEACLTGYFLEGGVRELARSADQLFHDLAAVHTRSGAPPFDLILGFYELWQTRLYNSALAVRLGGPDAGIRHVHRKIFLPTYGVFDEERFVEPGLRVEAFDLGLGRTAAIVCEDAWHSLVPTIAALRGAKLIAIPSASPARGLAEDECGTGRPGSMERWERVVRSIAGEHGVYVVLAQLVGFEGGKGFPGGSLVVGPSGEVLARGAVFEEDVLRIEVDLGEIDRARADAPLLSDLEMRLPHLVEALDGVSSHATVAPPSPPPLRPHPAPVLAPQAVRIGEQAGRDPLAIDPELARRWLVAFIRDEVQRRRGFTHAVIGLSGGVDSALVTFLAAEALGPEHVTAICMPYRTSSPESLAHARLVVEATGVGTEVVDISDAVDGLAGRLPEAPDATRLGNIMARLRMVTLFDRSAAHSALPLGTGNKTERLFGYFTWHADDAPPVNPIGDLFKTQVWSLARHLGVPAVIVDKPATADLVVGQTDEADIGITYPRADRILHWLLSGHAPESIVALGFEEAEVKLVRHRLDSTHWKRRLPTVAMVSSTAIGEYYLRPVDY